MNELRKIHQYSVVNLLFIVLCISDGQEEEKTLLAVSVEEENNQLEQDMELLELEDASDANSNSLFQLKASEIASEDLSQTTASGNRRYGLRPKKRPLFSSCEDSLCDVVENSSSPSKKRCMSRPNNGCLETIFEQPEVAKNGNLLVIGKSKIKRFISFNDFVTRTKNKHRKLRVKRLFKSKGKKPSRPKITLEDVKLKLKSLESNDEDESMDVADL